MGVNNGPPSLAQGYSTTVAGNALLAPLLIRSTQVGAVIRSVTVVNQSLSTTAVVYRGSDRSGEALFTVAPGTAQTLPVMASSAVYVVFVTQMGSGMAGSIYVHADPQALSATGYATSVTTTEWVWDSSVWNGGATWGP